MYAFKNTVLIGCISSLCLALSVSYEMVACFLFFLGFGMIGELIIAGTVFFEFCPPAKRRYLTLMSAMLGSGGTILALTALIIALTNTSPINDWRFIVAFGFVCEVLSLIFRYFMIETPAFCISKGNFERAEKILNIISVKNTGKEFKFDETDVRLSQLYEAKRSSIMTGEHESLLGTAPNKLLLKEMCKPKFLKIVIILSIVTII